MFIAIYKYSNSQHHNRIMGQQESEFQFQANQCLFAIQSWENIVDRTFLYLLSPGNLTLSDNEATWTYFMVLIVH